ncbi:Hypothetical predicted protein [Podarcis lilfordi]|uniref:Uncharacterized protein n=1 Tax=Podarcis lilfordi TaxID=74358 RepID=A0AA35JVQ5_9SAUR|nr:Hypothetical predicted protein [Podarcis lilfordi]
MPSVRSKWVPPVRSTGNNNNKEQEEDMNSSSNYASLLSVWGFSPAPFPHLSIIHPNIAQHLWTEVQSSLSVCSKTVSPTGMTSKNLPEPKHKCLAGFELSRPTGDPGEAVKDGDQPSADRPREPPQTRHRLAKRRRRKYGEERGGL